MVEIIAFKALHYSENIIGNDLSRLITQPYDKIDEKMQDFVSYFMLVVSNISGSGLNRMYVPWS